MDKPKHAEIKALVEQIKAAHGGDAPWLEKLILEAGYTRPEYGIRQKELIEGANIQRRVLLDWEKEGLETVTIDRKKYYPAVKFVAFVLERKRMNENQKSGRAKESREWESMDLRYKALERKRLHEERIGLLISREESTQMLVGIVLHTKTALLEMADALPPQLENQSVTKIRQLLTQRIEFLCKQMSQGKTPIPKQIGAEIKKELKRAGKAIEAIFQTLLG